MTKVKDTPEAYPNGLPFLLGAFCSYLLPLQKLYFIDIASGQYSSTALILLGIFLLSNIIMLMILARY